MAGVFQRNVFQNNVFQVGTPVGANGAGPGGTGGGGHGGARWERASSSDVKPGALSVKAQNKKERLELEQIEREIARQEQITTRKGEPTESELAIVKGLLAEARSESEKVTAMAAAFEAAERARSEQFARDLLAREELAREQAILDEEEEDILILLATIH